MNWEILIRGEAEGVGELARSRRWPEMELVRESDGVGGIDAKRSDDPAREINKGDVRRSVAAGAGTHPKRETTIAVSDGTTD